MCIDKPMQWHRPNTILNQSLRPMAAVASMVPLDASGTVCHREAMATGDPMNNQTQLSPMVVAIDLMRINVNALLPDDLQDHAVRVLDTIGALNDYINTRIPKAPTPCATPCDWCASWRCTWPMFGI